MRKSIEIKFLNEVFFRFGLKLTCTGKTLKDIASLGVKSQGIHIRFTNLYKIPRTAILRVIYLCPKVALLFCLYVHLEFFVHLENVFTHLETSTLQTKAIELWRFFNVLHLLRHGASVYNCHPRGPVTLTPNAECLAVELSLPV